MEIIINKADESLKIDINNRFIMSYAVGGLMYSPALRKDIADMLLTKKYKFLRSLAICLEDSIHDCSVEAAENQLAETFCRLENSAVNSDDIKELPMLFIRVRSAEQLLKVYDSINGSKLLTGFILPKFDSSNADGYISALRQVNTDTQTVYAMPIIESGAAAYSASRITELSEIKSAIDSISDIILNIRTGGNDFCNLYGLRRGINNTIYDISVIRDILSDIINIFGRDYVVSAPVWEYFSSGTDNSWEIGLRHEIRMDRLNGFIGKTVIHPSQLRIVAEEMKVGISDYHDALKILNWDSSTAVSKSSTGNRMNELKVHSAWAEKIISLASVYGIREDIIQ